MKASSRRSFLAAAAALALVTVAARPARAAEAEPADPAVRKIRAFYDALLATMKQADKLGLQGRFDRLAPVVRSTFDLPAMTRIAVGPEWNKLSADQHTALIDAFSRMTIATYANRFDGYSGERFEVEPTAETRSTGRVVRTKLVQSNGEAVPLDYLMRGQGEDWKAVDVYLTGTISELATRRSEFGSILKSGGASALVQSLKTQGDQLLRGGAAKS